MKALSKYFSLGLAMFIFLHIHAQDHKELFVQNLKGKGGYTGLGARDNSCLEGDAIITIQSIIPNLRFDSNVQDLEDIDYDNIKNEYVICHRPGRCKITVSSPEHTSYDIDIDGKSSIYTFKVSSKLSTGTVYFHTNPNNALVNFGIEDVDIPTAKPIEMPVGEYKVRVRKAGYVPVDMTVTVSGDQIIELVLKPTFASIFVDVASTDMSDFQSYPVVTIDGNRINLIDFLYPEKLKSFDDLGAIEYFKPYKGGIIPVPPGVYNVQITNLGFKTYSTILRATSLEGPTPLVARLEPFSGFLTISDAGGAAGAEIFLDENPIGTIPLFKRRIRVGNYKLRFEKEGFLTPEKEYKISIDEDSDEYLSIVMKAFKRYHIKSEPAAADIFVDGRRVGFTPANTLLIEGNHDIKVTKNEYWDYVRTLTIRKDGDNRPDTINIVLEKNYPIKISSEEKGLAIVIKKGKENITLDKANVTPAEINLPYGNYKLQLFENSKKRFSGNFTHQGDVNKIDAPCYSYGTFTTLVFDYFVTSPKVESGDESYYDLLGSGQFGRFTLFPGLSTSLARASVFRVTDRYKNKRIAETDDENNVVYDNFMFGFSGLFINGEFRMGGSILRQLDVCALGKFVWNPKMTLFLPLSHVSGSEMFFGVEVSSRISYLNVNFKLGQEIYKGQYNFLLDKGSNVVSNKFYSTRFDVNNFVFTVGLTLGEKVSRGNNMLRLWQKPFVSDY